MAVTAFLIALLAIPAAAQYTTASLGGTVVDPAGAAVPGASVKVENMDTGLTQSTTTDGTGAFVFPTLPVGNYRLRVEKTGFTPYVQEGIRLTVNQAASQTVTLAVGGLAESVTVSANAELVTTRSATAGQLVDEKKIVDLPLNGRQAQSLVYLAPGTVDTTDRYCGYNCFGGVYPGEQQASVNGTGPAQVNYELDGAGHNDTYLNMNLPFPNPDAIQEFNLESNNLSAQFGSAAGGVVNIVTKSGTNDIHGDVFEFLRNGSLNAKNFFAADHDTLKRNQFGGALGGPIMKNKLFYFGTYQGTRITSASGAAIAFVPSAAERTGDFSDLLPGIQLKNPVTGEPYPGNKVPADQLNPVAQQFLKYVPFPNGPNRQLTFLGPKSHQLDDQFLIKIDANLDRNQISGRYFDTRFEDQLSSFTDNILQGNPGSNVHIRNVSANETFSARPNLLFNTWFGWNYQFGGVTPYAKFGWPDIGVKIAQPANTPPESYVEIGGGFVANTNWQGSFNRGDWTVRENVTYIRGGHEMHFGGELVRLNKTIVNTYRMGGFFFFYGNQSGDNLADFILGRASSFVQGGGEFTNLDGWRTAFYAQDNWRVSPRLTLQLGLRWDPFFPYKDTQGRVTCFALGAHSKRYPNAPTGLIFGGDPGCPEAGTDNDLNNFAPRFGFAYRLTQDGRTSIRGGAGFYYTAASSDAFTMQTNAPFSPQYFLNGVDLTDPYGSKGLPNPFPAQYAYTLPGPDVQFQRPVGLFGAVPRRLQLPLVTTWNLFIERQLVDDLLLRVGYVGNKGTHMGTSDFFKNAQPLNAAVYIPGESTISNTQERRPLPDFGPVYLLPSGHNTHYNSLQVVLEKRFSHGLTLLSNYTWSKTIDDFGWDNPYNREFSRGISNDDVPHVFKFSGVYAIPGPKAGISRAVLGGWELTSNLVWRAGFPFTVWSGLDNSFSGVGQDRADFLGGNVATAQGKSHAEMVNQWFDTSKFVANAVGTFGNSGKNILRGPRFFNTDMGLIKDTRITERVSHQLRAEFFNIFNNVNFGNPVNTVSDPSFGRILSAGSPRILQFAMKLMF